jgi:DNA-binding NarL/FixJ family response regulator
MDKYLKGTRVLLAEDEFLEALDYKDRLLDAGAEVVGPFSSATTAIASLETSDIDVAVVDFALADQNSARLQEALEHRHIPYVVISGYPSVLVRRYARQRVLAKPIASEVLCRSVRAATFTAAAA